MPRRILVVEDSPTEALRARLILEQAGYQVSLASNGKEGIARAVEERPDLVILDSIMPRMSGYEAYQKLRVDPRTADIPVLMLLAETETQDGPRGLGHSADAYIAKPYAPPLLLAGVEQVTEAASAGEARYKENGLYEIVQGLGIGRMTLQDGRIVSVDPSAEALFGLGASELVGKLFIEHLGDDGPLFSNMLSRAEADGGGQGTFEVQVDGAGEARWWHISAVSTILKDRIVTHLACLDVTGQMAVGEETQRYDEALQQARREVEAARRAKSEFLAMMSHELRTPLHEFMGLTDLVLGTELTSEQRGYLNTAKASANALLAIINDILEFAELEAGQLSLAAEALDLWVAVEKAVEIMNPFAQEKGLGLSCRVAPDVPQDVVGDPVRLRQVLTNLIGNAVRFRAGRGDG